MGAHFQPPNLSRHDGATTVDTVHFSVGACFGTGEIEQNAAKVISNRKV